MSIKVERKILKIGGSKVIGLPHDWLRGSNINVGDKVELHYGSIIIIKPKNLKADLSFLLKEIELSLTNENAAAKT